MPIKKNVVWSPQPRQAEFMSRFETEALYGGAAGGGKSDALLAEATRQVDNPNYRGIILRKTFPECSELIDRSCDMYLGAYPNAKFNDNKHCWTFPSGAKIYFGSMQHRTDRTKYQGKRFDYIAFDELTHFTWDEYSYMFSRNRSGGEGLRCYIRSSTNPGGIGHAWVKSRFISGKKPFQTYYDEIDLGGKKFLRSRIFIPSTIYDNKILLKNSPEYLASLSSLPTAEKKALLYGDWNSFSGQVFSEFTDDPSHYNDMRYTHVIEPFTIPRHWRRWRSFDFGFSRPFSVAWWAEDNDGRLYRYRELYGSNGEPNVGIKWTPIQIAKKIREIEHKYERNQKITGIADPSIWDNSRGVGGSVLGQMESVGVYWEKADNTRIAGKMQLHYRLAFDENGQSMLYVFRTCKDFIRTVSSLCYDQYDVEDVDSSSEDHIYDETRYMLMARPISARQCMGLKESVPYDYINI